jgi:hypothetical protein
MILPMRTFAVMWLLKLLYISPLAFNGDDDFANISKRGSFLKPLYRWPVHERVHHLMQHS